MLASHDVQFVLGIAKQALVIILIHRVSIASNFCYTRVICKAKQVTPRVESQTLSL